VNSPGRGKPQRVRILAAPAAKLGAGRLRLLRFAYLAAIAISVLGVAQIFRLDSDYKYGIFVVASAALVLLFTWIGRGFRQLYEPLLRQRQQELSEKLVRGETLWIRGTPGVFVPLMLSLIALLFVLPNDVATTLPGRAWLLLCIVLLAVFWYWAVPRLRAPVLELDRNGLRTPDLGRVPWADVEAAQLRVNGSVDNGFIASHMLQLEFAIDRHPRPSHGLHRWAQVFFRGMREWEARIPLRNPSENPLVILNLVMLFIRNTPKYQERRSAAVMARAVSPPSRVQKPIPARRIIRQRLLPRTSPARVPQWVVIAVMLLVFVLCFYGLRVDFFSSEAWSRASILACMAIIALPCWHLGRAIMRGTINNPEVTTPFMRALFAWIFGPVLIYFLCWSVFASALPDIFTRMAGTRFEETHTLRKEHSYKRRGCDYRVLGPPFESGSLKSHYCTWSGEYDRLPRKGQMLVRGRKTWLGRHIDSVEPIDPLLNR
jgi:hypothetical protein